MRACPWRAWLVGAITAGLLVLSGVAPLAAQSGPNPETEAGAPSASSTTIRVAAYNIKHGRGMDDRVDLARIADVLRALDADVITLQEVDDRTERTGGVDQVAVLAEMLGYDGFHGPHRPYQGGFYGNAVLTRLPVRRVETVPIPPASGSALAVLEVEVEVEGAAETPAEARAGPIRLRVVSVHLAGSTEERMAQAESLTARYATSPTPVLLTGDFNGRPDDAVVRRLADSWSIAVKDGAAFTYPADVPDREIDFVMWPRLYSAAFVEATAGVSIAPLEHRVVPESLASDHRPLLIALELRRPTR